MNYGISTEAGNSMGSEMLRCAQHDKGYAV